MKVFSSWARAMKVFSSWGRAVKVFSSWWNRNSSVPDIQLGNL